MYFVILSNSPKLSSRKLKLFCGYIGILMNKSSQSNKEAKKELAMTPQEKGASKKEPKIPFGNALTPIKLR